MPNVGLELMTLRSRVTCSTHWASQVLPNNTLKKNYLFIFKDFICLFDRKRDSQREREHKQGEWERKKQAPSGAWSQMWGSIPGPWDHALSWRPPLNDWATQAPLFIYFREKKRERERDPVCIGEEKGRGRGRESQVDFLQSMGPDAGRYWPEPK